MTPKKEWRELFSAEGGKIPFLPRSSTKKDFILFGFKKIYPRTPEQCYVRQVSRLAACFLPVADPCCCGALRNILSFMKKH